MKVTDEFQEGIKDIKSATATLRWFATGVLLILIGITQAAFGWIGNSLWMRFFYSIACLVAGIAILTYLRKIRESTNAQGPLGDQFNSDDPLCPDCGEKLVSFITRKCSKCGAEF